MKYRSLPELMKIKITINKIETIEEDLKNAIREIFPEEHKLLTTAKNMEGMMIKYDFLDLTFSTNYNLLESEYKSGISLLKNLWFLEKRNLPENNDDEIWGDWFEEEPNCLSFLAEDIDRNKTYIKMFVESSKPRSRQTKWQHFKSFSINKLPPNYLPQQFIIKDACVSNSDSVWFHKYFFL